MADLWLCNARGAARARRAFISDLSKVESWLMAHLEAMTLDITNNHFKTLFRAICGFTGPKTPKIRPKRSKFDYKRSKFDYKIGTQGPRDPVLVPNESSP